MQGKFSKKIQGDNDALFMSVQEIAALHVGERLKHFQTYVELCTAVGAMAIQVAQFIPRVFGVDLDANRIKDAKENASTYGVQFHSRNARQIWAS